MGRLIELVVVLALAGGMGVLAWRGVAIGVARLNRWRSSHAQWELREDDGAHGYTFYAVAGSRIKELVSVPWEDPAYDMRVEEARADAKARIVAANSGHAKRLDVRRGQ